MNSGRQNLHIARQDNQIDAMLFEQVTLAALGFGLIFLGHFHHSERERRRNPRGASRPDDC